MIEIENILKKLITQQQNNSDFYKNKHELYNSRCANLLHGF